MNIYLMITVFCVYSVPLTDFRMTGAALLNALKNTPEAYLSWNCYDICRIDWLKERDRYRETERITGQERLREKSRKKIKTACAGCSCVSNKHILL